MTKLAIVYHSGYGHTAKVAEHVEKGASAVDGVDVTVLKADDLTNPDEGPWDALADADGIIFGAPTYMGSASAVFKQFQDATSKVWMNQGWRDKIGAGFTNSGSLAGDKLNTLQQLAILAGQHGMIWANYGAFSGYNSSQSDYETAWNRAGHMIGLGTQALTDLPAEQTPDKADLETAEDFGKRVAEVTKRWVAGKA
ncbi:flavodoxin family protein [Henriciella sp. AS95]|uniref:flavodoxin family protein n=1 Tax=Henriciella sp. AS95 TaxID=3135782 RepID=UPI00316BD69F